MPQTSSSFIGGPLTETPTSDEMTTNNAHSSMPPITSAFSTDPDMRSDTTSTKNIPPLTTPTTGTSEDQNSEKTMTTNAHITMLTSSSHVITRTRTSAFSTDPGTISDTTSKNMPPLTTPTAGNLSVFIGIGVLVSIIILMGMIIVIGVIIVIIYIKKKPVRAINIGQGISHQLETTLTKGTCENNCMRILFVNVHMTCKLSDYQIL